MTEDLEDTQIPKLHEDVLLRKEDFGLLVFNPKTDTVLQTNLVGAEIISHCDGRRSISEISKLIADIFEIEEEVASKDVKTFFSELVELVPIEYV